MITAIPTPREMRTPDELEAWIASQQLPVAKVTDVPPEWSSLECIAEAPISKFLLTCKGEDVTLVSFDQALPAGRLFVFEKPMPARNYRRQ